MRNLFLRLEEFGNICGTNFCDLGRKSQNFVPQKLMPQHFMPAKINALKVNSLTALKLLWSLCHLSMFLVGLLLLCLLYCHQSDDTVAFLCIYHYSNLSNNERYLFCLLCYLICVTFCYCIFTMDFSCSATKLYKCCFTNSQRGVVHNNNAYK